MFLALMFQGMVRWAKDKNISIERYLIKINVMFIVM